MNWFLAEKDNMEEEIKLLSVADFKDVNKPGCSSEIPEIIAHSSKAIEVPKATERNKYASLMEFPFADGSPIAELANFYKECLQARSATDEWADIAEASASTDSESLAQQLKMFEDAVPEFDNMVASMFSNSQYGSDHS
ncbi:unnamed protein product, partial [Iphiclides podalirius]